VYIPEGAKVSESGSLLCFYFGYSSQTLVIKYDDKSMNKTLLTDNARKLLFVSMAHNWNLLKIRI